MQLYERFEKCIRVEYLEKKLILYFYSDSLSLFPQLKNAPFVAHALNNTAPI